MTEADRIAEMVAEIERLRALVREYEALAARQRGTLTQPTPDKLPIKLPDTL